MPFGFLRHGAPEPPPFLPGFVCAWRHPQFVSKISFHEFGKTVGDEFILSGNHSDASPVGAVAAADRPGPAPEHEIGEEKILTFFQFYFRMRNFVPVFIRYALD